NGDVAIGDHTDEAIVLAGRQRASADILHDARRGLDRVVRRYQLDVSGHYVTDFHRTSPQLAKARRQAAPCLCNETWDVPFPRRLAAVRRSFGSRDTWQRRLFRRAAFARARRAALWLGAAARRAARRRRLGLAVPRQAALQRIHEVDDIARPCRRLGAHRAFAMRLAGDELAQRRLVAVAGQLLGIERPALLLDDAARHLDHLLVGLGVAQIGEDLAAIAGLLGGAQR